MLHRLLYSVVKADDLHHAPRTRMFAWCGGEVDQVVVGQPEQEMGEDGRKGLELLMPQAVRKLRPRRSHKFQGARF